MYLLTIPQHDDQKVKDFGIELAIKMIQRLTTEGDVRGVHFCTLNLERSVQKVLLGLGWIGNSAEQPNKLIVVNKYSSQIFRIHMNLICRMYTIIH